MIRIDSIWLATELMDMCAGTDTALARVVVVFGAAKPHCAYLFANRMKVLVSDGVPAHVIDKGIPTAGLIAHVIVAKFAEHLRLYWQEKIFGRAGLPIARSTLVQWVGACGVQLQPLVDALRDVVFARGVVSQLDVAFALDQIAFPVSGHQPVFNLEGRET